jgi:hypothetical protein
MTWVAGCEGDVEDSSLLAAPPKTRLPKLPRIEASSSEDGRGKHRTDQVTRNTDY